MRKFFVDLLRGWAKGLEKEQQIIPQAEELPEPEEAQLIIIPDQLEFQKTVA